jgi:argininosuccinate lyase
MWGGRFALGPSEALDALNRSLPVDHRLWPQDVFASKAWVHALCRAGVLSASEESQLLDGLDRVADKLADGAAVGAPDEDVHTLVERLLYAEIGALAGKLHTGRSRNDQVATDLRLWTLNAIDELDAAVAALGRTLVAKARTSVDAILPGYTHGQRAQPVRWAYVLLAHAWPLVRDRQRLADARRRTAELPLGSGALAGSGFPVDRARRFPQRARRDRGPRFRRRRAVRRGDDRDAPVAARGRAHHVFERRVRLYHALRRL